VTASGRIAFAAKHPWLARPWGRPAAFIGIFLVSVAAKKAIGDGNLALVTQIALPVLLVGYAVVAALPVRVEIGADGVLLGSLWCKRFIAFRELDTVEVEGRKIALSCGKRRLYLDALKPRRRAGPAADDAGLAALAAVRERFAVIQQARFPRELEEQLAIGLRAPGAWLASLEERGSRAGGYRDAPPDRAALLSLAQSPAALASARGAGAWLLMRSGLLPEERTLLLDSALSSVDPALRRALTAIAGADRSSIAAAVLLSGVARRAH
jgi:hypothetical protein